MVNRDQNKSCAKYRQDYCSGSSRNAQSARTNRIKSRTQLFPSAARRPKILICCRFSTASRVLYSATKHPPRIGHFLISWARGDVLALTLAIPDICSGILVHHMRCTSGLRALHQSNLGSLRGNFVHTYES